MQFNMDKWSYKTVKLLAESVVLQVFVGFSLVIVFIAVIRWRSSGDGASAN